LAQIEQEEIEVLKRIRTTTQVHKTSNTIYIILVIDEFEKMNIQEAQKQYPMSSTNLNDYNLNKAWK
jgi:hypothetical protein